MRRRTTEQIKAENEALKMALGHHPEKPVEYVLDGLAKKRPAKLSKAQVVNLKKGL